MARHVLSLQDLGESGSWLLVQQARGIPDARSHTDFMTERMAMLLFAQESLPERLCSDRVPKHVRRIFCPASPSLL